MNSNDENGYLPANKLRRFFAAFLNWRVIYMPIPLFLFISNCEQQGTKTTEDIQLEFRECLVETSTSSFDIVTWNLKNFPLRGDQTIEITASMITSLNADLIALQEISDIMDFNALLSRLPDWDGYLYESGGLNLAFLYKKSEVDLIGAPQALFRDNSYAFPRPPLLISANHQNGMNIYVINIHLKCCDGTDNEKRRREAGILIKEYIDNKLSDENVMILGDFNDEISLTDSTENVFHSFITDSLNYSFSDMEIATDHSDTWSFPSWPSHIDHILITDELFPREFSTTTLTLDLCDEDYLTLVSDHRPLMVRLSP